MAAQSHWTGYVKCPYYRSDDGKSSIRCEGVTDASVLCQQYAKKADFTLQIKVFCCEHYKKCELYELLERKYEDA